MDCHSEDGLVFYGGGRQETFYNLKRQNHVSENVI